MPTYEYACEACGHTFEHSQSIADAPLAECPKCGGHVKRLISSSGGVIVKGGSGGACSLRDSGSTCCGLGEPCSGSSCGR